MSKRICLIYLEKQKSGLYRTSNNINVAIIRALLKKYDIESFQYLEDELPSVMEFADDILATMDDDLVYFVNEGNVHLSMAVASELAQLEEVNQYFILESDISFDLDIDGVKVLSGDYEQELLSLLDVDVTVDNEKVESGLQVYSNNIVSVEKVEEIGVFIGRKKEEGFVFCQLEDIYKELDEIKKRYDGIKDINIPLLTMKINAHPYYKEMMNKLVTEYACFNFIMSIDIDEVEEITSDRWGENLFFNLDIDSEEDIKRLLNIKKVANIKEIRCNHGIINSAIKSFKKFMKFTMKNSIQVSFYCRKQEDYWIEDEKDDLKELITTHCSDNYNAMSLGFTLSQTGEYVGIPLVGVTKHILLNKDQVSEEKLLKLNEFCSINSALHIYDDQKEKQEENTKAKYHFNYYGEVIKYDAFQEEKKQFLIQNHILPINMVTFSGEKPLNINNINNEKGKKYLKIPYSKVNIDKAIDQEHMIMLTVNTEQDLDKLLADAELFRETNNIGHSPLRYYNLQNVCRFMSRNYCQVEELPHFRVDDEGDIYPCIDNAVSVGNMQDTYFDIKQNTYMQYENAISRRKCTSCEAVAVCTRCAYLPAFMEDKYCDIIKHKNYISDFVIESKVLPNLIRACKGYEKVQIEDIKIINEHMFLYTKDEIYGSEAPYFAKYVFLTECKGMYTIWSPITNKVYKISKEISIIAECLLRRWAVNDISNYLVQKLSLEESIVEELCNVAYEKFFEYNLLHRPIK